MITLASNLLLGTSPALQFLRDQVSRLAGTTLTVLIEGETGVGKKLIARAIHLTSPRSGSEMVRVNCATRSAFARIEVMLRNASSDLNASGMTGSVLFEEVGALDLARQATLVALLDSRAADNVQIFCTTSSGLEPKVECGDFRADLYYRINVVHLFVPPLRERRDDIPILAFHFLRAWALAYGRSVSGFSESTMQSYLAANWPGNVRQLENEVKRYVLVGEKGPILPETAGKVAADTTCKVDAPALKALRQNAIRDCEYKAILVSLERNYWNRRRTARELQVSYGYLLKIMRRLGLPRKQTPDVDDVREHRATPDN